MSAHGPARGERVATFGRAATDRERHSADQSGDEDLAPWFSFMNTRAGRRVERQAAQVTRLRLGGAALVALLLVAGLLAWRPWSSPPTADTGDAALGGDRATVLLAVADGEGRALLCALLRHDRAAGSGSLLVVPAGLMLPVPGAGRLALAHAFVRAGPTVTRGAVGDAIGVLVDGTWVLPGEQFSRFVDHLGGVEVTVNRSVTRDGRTVVPAGAQRLDGASALAYAADSAKAAQAGQVLRALVAAVPRTFSGTRDVLGTLGVVGDAGLPVDRLAALLSGMARDAEAGRLRAGALPVDPVSAGVDVAGAAPLVRDLLDGRPRPSPPADVAPRVMVQLPKVGARSAAQVRAAVVGGGYEYVEGGIGSRRRSSSVLVRPGAGPRGIGEAVALTLGLPRTAVRPSEDVPVVADVLVVLGADAGI